MGRPRTVTGTLRPDASDWYYLPVDVPAGVREIEVGYSYGPPAGATGWPGQRTGGCRVITASRAFIRNHRGHHELGLDTDPRHRLPAVFGESAGAISTAWVRSHSWLVV